MLKIKIYLFSAFLLLILFEATTFIYFKFISNDKYHLALYSEKRNGALSYRYFENVGLVLPNVEDKKDLIMLHYTKEFLDRFTFRDILGLGFGFPDDGIDERKFKAVAIGDSFTRGVGALDNLKNGWVELIEKKNKDIDIINLGHLGTGINDEKYKYDKLKNFMNHDIVIYNSFSPGDYRENLFDQEYAIYVEKFYKEYGREETQKLVDDLNIRHGFKRNLEYLKNNKFKSYSVYFVLKVADYFSSRNLFPAKKFAYDVPENEIRLNTVDDELVELSKNKNYYKIICNVKYCYQSINKEIITEELLEKIKLNFAKKLNEFYEESIKDNKNFIFVLHSHAGHFYPNPDSYDFMELDESLLKLLDPGIKVINVPKKLAETISREKNKSFYYKYDGHYNVNGYKAVSDIINDELVKILK